MWKYLLLLLAVLISACNLSNEPVAEPPTATFAELSTDTPVPTPALTDVNVSPQPTALATPGSLNTGRLCDVYTTYSGTDARNVLSMRAEPSADSAQVLRVPNNAPVFLVPGSQEVEAEGYHWLNVIYVDASQNRYEGWIARDSFMSGGVRDPSVSTLRSTGRQAAC
jgi:hypothetical protein